MRSLRSRRSVSMVVVLGGVLLLRAMSPGTLAAQAPTCQNFVGWWRNQLNSTMRISKVDTGGPTVGLVSGCYCSPSGTTGNWYPLRGWVNGLPPSPPLDNVVPISWTVRWSGIGSITSWSGYCRTSGSTAVISAPWYLVRPNSTYTWDHRYADTDTFSPATSPSCSNPIPTWCQ